VWNRYGIKVDKKDFPILLQGSALRKRYHPVKEYFASLTPFAACFTLAVSLITFSFLKVRKAS
jgi:hypothetical protein